MSSRVPSILLIVGAVGLIAAECVMLSRAPAGERWFDAADRAVSTMVDKLEMVDTAPAFSRGEMENASILSGDADASPARVVLNFPKPKGFPRQGTWTSPRVSADFPFTELLPSWNVITPANTGVIFHVRTRDLASRRWSPWMLMGSWGRTTYKHRLDRSDFGWVDEDTLKLTRPADAYQVRATLQSYDFDAAGNPSVRRIAVVYSGSPDADSAWANSMSPAALPAAAWARSLDVPYFPQGDNADPIAGMTCSPTSVSMVLHYWGVNPPPMENCLAIWDDRNEIFGNWSNATQRAAELGMDAWLERFRNWEQVKAKIAQGQPVIASILYEKGTFIESEALEKRQTEGHLLVIRGFTP